MINFYELDIKGAYLVKLTEYTDHRGSFIKTFHDKSFQNTPMEFFQMKEEFYSISKKGVLRGLHFQEPPYQHEKLVYVFCGSVLDFFVDIRLSSPTYGRTQSIMLSGGDLNAVYLPAGIAHGFYALSDKATVVYKTNCSYAPEYDRGIHWKSADIDKPIYGPVVSDRDRSFPMLDDYESPFL